MFKEIAGYPNYLINSVGFVINKNTKKTLTFDMSSGGYHRVTLSKDGKARKYFVHRLVAMHFLEPVEGLSCVNHIDGDKLNNHIQNLEWISRSDNQKHAFKLGLQKPNRKYSEESVRRALVAHSYGAGFAKIYEMTAVPKHVVEDALRKRSWVHLT